MPIVEVTYGPQVTEEQLLRLGRELPHAVSLAVACPEEPFDEDLQPGDVEIRFHPRGPYDSNGLAVVAEVRSKWFSSRAENRQQRSDQLRDAMVQWLGAHDIGVYLSLPVAGWSQTPS